MQNVFNGPIQVGLSKVSDLTNTAVSAYENSAGNTPNIDQLAAEGTLYTRAYPYQEVVLPPKVVEDWDDIPERLTNYVTTKNAQMSEEQKKKAVAAYYASVSYMDTQVGKVLNTLKEEGLEDNIIVIFTSDHGFHLGDHGSWMKVSLRVEIPIHCRGISGSFKSKTERSK